ncbi:MAG: hypothetical protein L0228_17255 [Planctomycetes bacterium]|nr:hypothetical protein [Planctomycetota bacterium]
MSLESFADVQKGGSRGPAIVPGRADASLLVRVLSGEVEPAMPPEDNERPTEAEIAVLHAWIDAGAKGPDGAESQYPELVTPELAAAANVREFVTSLAVSGDGKRLALGRYRHVDLVDPTTKVMLATTPELPGKVNSVAFSADGTQFVAASGIPGLYGAATICSAKDGAIVSQVKGHRDALYDARLSPDGRLLATCSYDRQINLWDVASGKIVRTLSGHNGAVFELAFSADGAVLASASADDTVKIWSVATGERLDTLGQPEGSQSAVAISPDDKWIVAGGADRQVRMWRFLSREKAQINPLRFSRTAHDSPVVELAFSPDGSKLVTASESRELVLWDTAKLTPVHNFEQQPDVVTGIAFDPSGTAVYVARIDGSWQRYETVARNDERLTNAEPQPGEPVATLEPAEGAPKFDGAEQEPNNAPDAANQITADAVVRGVIGGPGESGKPDVDLLRFHAQKGQQCVLEINAARQKSPLDSKLEVLDASGKPVPRVLLQAVRASYFTFRGHNSTDLNDYRLHGWQDMELNEYLFANGEVNKLWLYPRGPDSGFLVYPGTGQRYSYFGTTAISHALNEPCYIVEAHPPGAKLIPNGLPQYTINHENDDDGWRKLGNDSRVVFTAPADGDYLVRVSDVRDMGGDDYKYELTVRAHRPDFQIRVEGADLTINAGSGKEFSVVADRVDDFDDEIRVDVAGLPPGFHVSTPLVIQAGQTTAFGTITVNADAAAPTAENSKLAKLTASAVVEGNEVTKEGVGLGELKLAEKPKILVQILPSKESPQPAAVSPKPGNEGGVVEFFIEPGQTISAVVKVERNGFDGEILFGEEYSGRNLPHGVFIDNIGLNGLTLLSGETERQFFITAAKWVPETSRLFHLRSNAEGNQTSWPVMLHVRSSSATAGVSAALQ